MPLKTHELKTILIHTRDINLFQAHKHQDRTRQRNVGPTLEKKRPGRLLMSTLRERNSPQLWPELASKSWPCLVSYFGSHGNKNRFQSCCERNSTQSASFSRLGTTKHSAPGKVSIFPVKVASISTDTIRRKKCHCANEERPLKWQIVKTLKTPSEASHRTLKKHNV